MLSEKEQLPLQKFESPCAKKTSSRVSRTHSVHYQPGPSLELALITQMHTRTQTHARKYRHRYTHTHTHTRAHTHTSKHPHPHTGKSTTYPHTHTHTHTHTRHTYSYHDAHTPQERNRPSVTGRRGGAGLAETLKKSEILKKSLA
jgi:hypothetical protein